MDLSECKPESCPSLDHEEFDHDDPRSLYTIEPSKTDFQPKTTDHRFTIGHLFVDWKLKPNDGFFDHYRYDELHDVETVWVTKHTVKVETTNLPTVPAVVASETS
jgi:hypothetical protein